MKYWICDGWVHADSTGQECPACREIDATTARRRIIAQAQADIRAVEKERDEKLAALRLDPVR